MVISGSISNSVTNKRLQFRKLGTKRGILSPKMAQIGHVHEEVADFPVFLGV